MLEQTHMHMDTTTALACVRSSSLLDVTGGLMVSCFCSALQQSAGFLHAEDGAVFVYGDMAALTKAYAPH